MYDFDKEIDLKGYSGTAMRLYTSKSPLQLNKFIGIYRISGERLQDHWSSGLIGFSTLHYSYIHVQEFKILGNFEKKKIILPLSSMVTSKNILNKKRNATVGHRGFSSLRVKR